MIYSVRRFSKTDTREDVPEAILEKAKTSGVIQKVDGDWRIISLKKEKFWPARYQSKSKAQASLRAYQSNK